MKNYNRLLEGKRVFVTTGARGIGKEIALLFASQGAVVAVGGKNVPCLCQTGISEESVTHQMPHKSRNNPTLANRRSVIFRARRYA